MGTPAQTIIQQGYREGNLIPVGQQPSALELAEALPRLNAFIKGVYGQELGEPLMDWLVPAPQRTASIAANYPQLPFPTDIGGDIWPLPNAADPSQAIYSYPPKNSRIVFGGVTQTCWFPEAPEPGTRMAIVSGSGAGDDGTADTVLTIDGNGKWIMPTGGPVAATYEYTFANEAIYFFFREDLQTWVQIDDLALTDEMPFPEAFDDFWICVMAKRLAPRYGKTLSTDTAELALKTLMRLKTHYRQSAPTVYGSSDFPRSLQSYISGRWWW